MYEIVHDQKDLGERIGQEYLEEIRKRLCRYLNVAKTFVIERSYIDREWREEFSLFYTYTFYKDVPKFTTRIHFISVEISDVGEIENLREEDYLGYVVLRPVPSSNKILKIILRPLKYPLGVEKGERLFMISCTIKSHINGREFEIETFPFYSQDSMVTVCAHACMWMVTKFLNSKYGHQTTSIGSITKNLAPMSGRLIPSHGLYPTQMIMALSLMGYNVVLKRYCGKKDEDLIELLRRIDAYLESGLPPILIFDAHVVVLTGHTLDKSGSKNYIIFDDSGYHMSNWFVGMNVSYFGYKVPKNNLIEALTAQEEIFLINFEFERQYFPLESILALLSIFNVKINDFKGGNYCRICLVDSNHLKIFFKALEINDFGEIDLPHYVWLVEVYEDFSLASVLILDASAHKFDFYGSILALWVENQLNIYTFKSKISAKAKLKTFKALTEVE